MGNDSKIINSFGLEGKVIKKYDEVRDVKNYTEEEQKNILEKAPEQLKHCVKLSGVEPPKQSTIIDVEYDLDKGVKHVTYAKERHSYSDPTEKGASKKYKKTTIQHERYPFTISQHEMNVMTKNELLDKIKHEVGDLDLSDFKTKEDVLKFANGDGYISNTEKKRRAVELIKSLQKQHDDDMAKYHKKVGDYRSRSKAYDNLLVEKNEIEKKEEDVPAEMTEELEKLMKELEEMKKNLVKPKFERPHVTSLEISNL